MSHEHEIPQLVGSVIRELTNGRPYVFGVRWLGGRAGIWKTVAETIQRDTPLACITADETHMSGYDLLAQIHALIEGAALIVADISEARPNVFYEVGYARAIGKRT